MELVHAIHYHEQCAMNTEVKDETRIVQFQGKKLSTLTQQTDKKRSMFSKGS